VSLDEEPSPPQPLCTPSPPAERRAADGPDDRAELRTPGTIGHMDMDVDVDIDSCERPLDVKVGRCRLPVSKPVLKAHMVTAIGA